MVAEGKRDVNQEKRSDSPPRRIDRSRLGFDLRRPGTINRSFTSGNVAGNPTDVRLIAMEVDDAVDRVLGGLDGVAIVVIVLLILASPFIVDLMTR